MTKPLDPKFAKVVRLMRSTTHDGERASARTRATVIAKRCGMTLDEALRLHDAPTPTVAPHNFMDGFDDFMEAREPGYKAREAERRNAKVQAWVIRRAAIIARYGSAEAALAPCWRERLILDAVAPWRTTQAQAPRWTDRLDGWRGSGFEYTKAPAHIVEAIVGAYPLPTTFTEAKAESDYWEARNCEMEDVVNTKGAPIGDTELDLVADIRGAMVRDLAEKGLHVTKLADLHARFVMYREADYHDSEMVDALFRDLTTMMEREATKPASEPTPSSPIRPGVDSSIRDALIADASRSDRDIARAIGCSPTTVGRIRGQMGLSDKLRSVLRGGQMYRMRARSQREASGR